MNDAQAVGPAPSDPISGDPPCLTAFQLSHRVPAAYPRQARTLEPERSCGPTSCTDLTG
jgi:hypothetical protein